MQAVSFGQLRASSFSIQVSTRTRCNGACKFCISRLTQNIPFDGTDHIKTCDSPDIHKGLRFAKQLGATHCILTGKADPTQEDVSYMEMLISESKRFLPLVDIHTNGIKFLTTNGLLQTYIAAGLTNITFSVAHMDDTINKSIMGVEQNPTTLITAASMLGLFTRCSLVLCKAGVSDIDQVLEYVKIAGDAGAHAVVIRELWNPTSIMYDKKNAEVYEWNRENFIPTTTVSSEFIDRAKLFNGVIEERAPLPWGARVFAVGKIFNDPEHGVNVTFARCDEAVYSATLKSIVHKPNGHGYRNWDHNGDILY